MKPTADYAAFEALDLRVGRVVAVAEARARKPTYRLSIDFGPELGVKTSCAALRHYAPEELVGRQLIAVVNLGVKKMGPEVSEVFVVGVPDGDGAAIVLGPDRPVPEGGAVF